MSHQQELIRLRANLAAINGGGIDALTQLTAVVVDLATVVAAMMPDATDTSGEAS